MSRLYLLLTTPLTPLRFDYALARWTPMLGGLALLLLSLWRLPAFTRDRADLVVGILSASAACLMTCVYGLLTGRLQRALAGRALAWHWRLGEVLAAVMVPLILAAALRFLPFLALNLAQLTTLLLLVITLVMAGFSLSTLATLLSTAAALTSRRTPGRSTECPGSTPS
jgi:hypothetical protein